MMGSNEGFYEHWPEKYRGFGRCDGWNVHPFGEFPGEQYLSLIRGVPSADLWSEHGPTSLSTIRGSLHRHRKESRVRHRDHYY